MNTQHIKITDPEKDAKILSHCADILDCGGLVVFPTETVYGLGGKGTDPDSAKKIYAAKGRPSDNPLIIHIARPEDAEKYAYINDTYDRLAKAFMPGPLTVILPKRENIPSATTGGLDSVAVRCPSHPVAHKLLELCDFPVAAPSANLSGKPSPTCAAHVAEDMNGRVDVILDGGDCEIGLESTIVKIDGDNGNILTLLRPGAVTYDALCMVCDRVEISAAVTEQLKKDERPLSPGMKYRHYAPNAPLILLEGDPSHVLSFLQKSQREQNCAILAYEEEMPALSPENVFCVGAKADLSAQAKCLFHALRDADHSGTDIIYAHLPPRDGLGLALYNRMIRAAAHTVQTID